MVKRVLGIDPGSRLTGFGIIEQTPGNAPTCIAGGCIRLSATQMPLRLQQLFKEVQEIVMSYQPTELAIEQVFVHKNANSALKLGQARGVILAAAMITQLPVFEYAPRQIKQAIVGRGGADKSQIQHMMQVLLTLREKPQADTADALAVALCHLHSSSVGLLMQTGLKKTRSAKRSNQWKNYDRTITR